MAQNRIKKRIGVHVGTSGGVWTAVQRAVDAGANTFQIFSASPRQWKAAPVKPEDAAKMRSLRAELDVNPVAIHASYLINLCSQTESVRANSIDGFRGEVDVYKRQFTICGSKGGDSRHGPCRHPKSFRVTDIASFPGSFRLTI